MKQSRMMSLIEAIVSILVGFGISVAAQAFFLPMLGIEISLRQNLSFALIMTAISIARQYVMRRIFEVLHIRRPLTPFMQAAIAERFRQIEQEGWTILHDDEHEPGDLAKAASCYAMYAGLPPSRGETPAAWPWSAEWWKPNGFRRDMVRATALLFAEGEKFDRSRNSRGGFIARKPADLPAQHRRPF